MTANRLLVLRRHTYNRDAVTREVNGLHRSLYLPTKARPKLYECHAPFDPLNSSRSDPLTIFGIKIGYRCAVPGISRIGKILNKCPNGPLLAGGALSLAGNRKHQGNGAGSRNNRPANRAPHG